MVLGKYPPQSETQLISQSWLDAAVMRYKTYIAVYGDKPPLNIVPRVGMDVADHGPDHNELVFRYGGYVPPLIHEWKGVDPDHAAIHAAEIVGKIAEELRIKPYSIPVFVDATGVGAGVAPRMKRLGIAKAQGVYVASAPTEVVRDVDGVVMAEFNLMRDQLWWACARWLEKDPSAMLPPDDDLLQELHTPLYEIKNGRIRVTNKDTMKALLGRSPDKADALCMTFAPAAVIGGAMR
jgi:hypothetical protein